MIVKRCVGIICIVLILAACSSSSESAPVEVATVLPDSQVTIPATSDPASTDTILPTSTMVPPTHTPTATPTPVDTDSGDESRLESINIIERESLEPSTTLPENILEEIGIVLEGGGGEGDVYKCEGSDAIQVFNYSIMAPIQKLFEVNQLVEIHVCTGHAVETFTFSLKDAQENLISETSLNAAELFAGIYTSTFNYQFPLDGEGDYFLTISAGESELTHKITIVQPESGRVYHTDMGLQFYNFSPHETIFIVEYGPCPEAITSTVCPHTSYQFQVDANGEAILDQLQVGDLTLDPNGRPEMVTFIYADESEQVLNAPQYASGTTKWEATAVVTTDVYSTPNLESPIVQTLQRGDAGFVTGEARYESPKGLVTVVHVRLADGSEGWARRDAFSKGQNFDADNPLVNNVESIGTATNGVEITAYRFGQGDQDVILIGGYQGGNSPNSIQIAGQLIDYFTEHDDQIPDELSIYVVFNANPTTPARPGVISGRLNSNNVDINRNWDCNWQPTGIVNGETVSGGDQPFSEVETQNLRDMALNKNTKLVVVWGAKAEGGLVAPGWCHGEINGSDKFAQIFADAAGYDTLAFNPAAADVGDITNWLDYQGIPAIYVLTPTYTEPDWDNNLQGVLAVMNTFSE